MTEEERPHDVLAADEFTVPAVDPTLTHGPVDVPDAPFTAGDPPHDVLAAEEFAMPAGPLHGSPPPPSRGRSRAALAAGAALVGAIVTIVLRRRS